MGPGGVRCGCRGANLIGSGPPGREDLGLRQLARPIFFAWRAHLEWPDLARQQGPLAGLQQQLELALRSRDAKGRFASPYRTKNPPSAEVLAAAASPRVNDQAPRSALPDLAAAGLSVTPGQLELELPQEARIQEAVQRAMESRPPQPEWGDRIGPTARRLRAEDSRERTDRRTGKGTSLGPASGEVQQARAEQFQAALLDLARRRPEAEQLTLRGAGFNPTLMALRSREPMNAQQAVEAGMTGYGWQHSPALSDADAEQLQLLLAAPVPANAVVAFTRSGPVPAAAPSPEVVADMAVDYAANNARPPRRFADPEQLSRLLAYTLAGGGGFFGSGLALATDPQEHQGAPA